MAVSVPGWKAHDTPSTATWPPKRIVRFRVSSTGRPRSTLVANRDVHLFRLDLPHQLRHAPREGRVHLDPEVIHRLHRLMVLGPEGHLALGRLEAHALHGLDELVGRRV